METPGPCLTVTGCTCFCALAFPWSTVSLEPPGVCSPRCLLLGPQDRLCPAAWGQAWPGSRRHSCAAGLSQVSHHPPSAAHHVFSKNGWSLWQEITISSKFRGKYLSIMPLGEPGLCPPRAETFWIRGRVFPHPEASLEPPGPCPFPSV